MKMLAFVVFAVSVLMISAFSHAATLADYTQPRYETPTPISDVQADGQNLYVSGVFNPCFGDVAVLLTQDANFMLTVHVSSPAPQAGKMCAQYVKEFNHSVDLSRLVQTARVQIDPRATYEIKVEGTNFSMQVPGSALQH